MTAIRLHELALARQLRYVVDEDFAEPSIAELTVTSDGHVLATQTGDIGANNFIGAYAELESNFTRLLDAAELSAEERAEFATLYRKKMGRPLQ